MRLHLTKKHSMGRKRCPPLDFANHVQHYSCKECEKRILHDPDLIGKHIRVSKLEGKARIEPAPSIHILETAEVIFREANMMIKTVIWRY